MDSIEKSLSELMAEAFNLSLELAYGELSPDGVYFTPRDNPKFESCNVWSWCDGLMHKFYESRASGRCSLQAIIDFDIAQFEEGVKKDIAGMKEILAEIGPPKTLTYEEMRRRGYRGAWAGYTPEEDRQFYLEQAQKHLTEAEKGFVTAKTYDDIWHYNELIAGYKRQIRELNGK